MKKFYENVQIEITELSITDALLASGSNYNVRQWQETDGDITTIPGGWQ